MNKVEISRTYSEFVATTFPDLAQYKFENSAGDITVEQKRDGGVWATPYYRLNLWQNAEGYDRSMLLSTQALLDDALKVIDLINLEMKGAGSAFSPLTDPLHYKAREYAI